MNIIGSLMIFGLWFCEVSVDTQQNLRVICQSFFYTLMIYAAYWSNHMITSTVSSVVWLTIPHLDKPKKLVPQNYKKLTVKVYNPSIYQFTGSA